MEPSLSLCRGLLRQLAVTIEGKPQKIEIRGHTLRNPVTPTEQYQDNWDLAYARSRAVMQYLQDVVKIKPIRFRVSVAEANEPIHTGTDRAKLRQNARVEVYMLNEVVTDLIGTKMEKEQRYQDAR